MKSRYRQTIIKATGCTEKDAVEVEELMRATYHTLDGLSRQKFVKESKSAYQELLWSRTPAGMAYVEQLKKEFYGI